MGKFDELAGGFVGSLENMGRIATGAVATPFSGLYGAYKTMVGGADAGAQAVQDAQEALTYQPRTATGQNIQQSMAQAMQPITQTLEGTRRTLGDAGYKLAGPAGAAALSTLPEIAGMGAGRIIGGMSKGASMSNLTAPRTLSPQAGSITMFERDQFGTPVGVGKTLPNELEVPPSSSMTRSLIPDKGTSLTGYINSLNGGQSEFAKAASAGGQTYGPQGSLGRVGVYRAGMDNKPIPESAVNRAYYNNEGNIYANPDVMDAIPPKSRQERVQRDFNDAAQGAYNHQVGVKPDHPFARAAAMFNKRRDDQFFRSPTATIGVRG